LESTWKEQLILVLGCYPRRLVESLIKTTRTLSGKNLEDI
jgi:hypothetical protein